jgi:hypothetical protein
VSTTLLADFLPAAKGMEEMAAEEERLQEKVDDAMVD